MMTLSNFKKVTIFFTLILFSLSPFIVVAETTGGNNDNVVGGNTGGTSFKITIPPPLKFCTKSGDANCSLSKLIDVIIKDIVFPVGGAVVVLMIMYSGFLFVTAQGNQTKLDKAKTAILYAMIGGAILLGARVLAAAIQATISQLG